MPSIRLGAMAWPFGLGARSVWRGRVMDVSRGPKGLPGFRTEVLRMGGSATQPLPSRPPGSASRPSGPVPS